MQNRSIFPIFVIASALFSMLAHGDAQGQVIIDHTCTDLEAVPRQWINRAVDKLRIAYNFTCPGSHIVSGMNALESFPPYDRSFEWSDDGSGGLDLVPHAIPCSVSDLGEGDFIDENGVTPWVTCTRDFLDSSEYSEFNVVMWAWCSVNGHDAQRYVDNMELLVAEYPAINFIFMTGRAQGQGEDNTPGSVYFNNQLIREHCISQGRTLFDFADIEAYDPDGAYFWAQDMWDNLDYLGGNWAEEWVAFNPDSILSQLTTGIGVPGYEGCKDCANSDSPSSTALNCVLKARAAWWMFSALAGWHEGTLPQPRRSTGRLSPGPSP